MDDRNKNMNPDVKREWIAALTSGEYSQTKGRLRSGNSYCCLGVLCDIYSKKANQEWQNLAKYKEILAFIGSEVELPLTVMEWAGLSSSSGLFGNDMGLYTYLADLNDNGMPFEEIAKVIEENF